MLIESVLLTLIERSVLTKADVLESVEIVIETKRSLVDDERSAEVERAVTGLLINMVNSLRASAPRSGGP